MLSKITWKYGKYIAIFVCIVMCFETETMLVLGFDNPVLYRNIKKQLFAMAHFFED